MSWFLDACSSTEQQKSPFVADVEADEVQLLWDQLGISILYANGKKNQIKQTHIAWEVKQKPSVNQSALFIIF